MATEGFIGNLSNIAGEQAGDIVKSSFGMLMNLPGMEWVVKLFQVAGVLAVVYILFLIMKTIAGWKSASRLKVVAKNITEINQKMDILISKVSGKNLEAKNESKATKNKK
jgi:hypothetical protein